MGQREIDEQGRGVRRDGEDPHIRSIYDDRGGGVGDRKMPSCIRDADLICYLTSGSDIDEDRLIAAYCVGIGSYTVDIDRAAAEDGRPGCRQ